MQVKTITLDPDEYVETVTVEMSLNEAIFVANVCHRFAGVSADQLAPQGSLSAHEVSYKLESKVFNRFWEDGVEEAEQYAWDLVHKKAEQGIEAEAMPPKPGSK